MSGHNIATLVGRLRTTRLSPAFEPLEDLQMADIIDLAT